MIDFVDTKKDHQKMIIFSGSVLVKILRPQATLAYSLSVKITNRLL